MGLFGNFFEKKTCDVCGAEISLLGNRKLEDGNLCKKCAAKLSPWFSERRHSTLAEIKAQLAYREANRGAVAAFHCTRTLGENMRVLLDEDAGTFLVTGARDLAEENPDVLQFEQVTGCDVDIDETRTEQTYRDKQGNEVGYKPPRYLFRYDFTVVVHVNHPYFDEMRFRLNNSPVEVDSGPGNSLLGGSGAGERSMAFRQYRAMAEQIKSVLTEARQTVRETKAAAQAPKAACTCPWCGATTTPDANGCCAYCGGALH